MTGFWAAVARGAKKSIGTVLFLLKIMLPVSLAVAILGWTGWLAKIAQLLAPLMRLLGLPGEGAFVFISGSLLSNYAAIAVMGTLPLSVRDATILALMCLTSHNLLVETAVMKKVGSSAVKMVFLRVGTALIAAFLLNLILPASMAQKTFMFHSAAAAQRGFFAMLGAWFLSTGSLVVKMSILVALIMIVQELFVEYRIMNFLARLFAPLMKIFGLPGKASFLWLIVNTVGYAYGAGVIVAACEAGQMTKKEADLFNHHAAISHSLLEDTILYAAIGLPAFWISVPRLVLAMAVVWLELARRRYFRASFRAGIV